VDLQTVTSSQPRRAFPRTRTPRHQQPCEQSGLVDALSRQPDNDERDPVKGISRTPSDFEVSAVPDAQEMYFTRSSLNLRHVTMTIGRYDLHVDDCRDGQLDRFTEMRSERGWTKSELFVQQRQCLTAFKLPPLD
jgi:hypothetical protein